MRSLEYDTIKDLKYHQGSLWNRLIRWSTTLFKGDLREFHFACNFLTPPDTKHVPNKHALSKRLNRMNEKEIYANVDMELSRIWGFTFWYG